MAELIGRCVIKVDYSGDWQAQEDDQLYRYRQQFKAEHPGDLVGEVVKWQRADGYAQYMVVCEEPLQLAHLNMGDAWTIEPALIRGLILEDIKEMVDGDRAMAKLFAEHRANKA